MTTADGYSGTPLDKKLGIKKGHRCFLLNPPDHYWELMRMPENVSFDTSPSGTYDLIHAFFLTEEMLRSNWPVLKSGLRMNGSLWVSWPKGGSKLATDLHRNLVRKIGLTGGLVDVKVCSVDADWSGLKFMWRIKDR